MNGTVPFIASSLLELVETQVNLREVKQHEELLSLHTVFGAVLQRALDILEKYSTLIVYKTTSSKRELIEVKGENDRCYRVFPRVNFCPCRAFKHQVIEKRNYTTCKHVVAARISLMLDRITIRIVTNEQYLMLLRSMYDIEDKT